MLDALSQDEIEDILNALGKVNGSGWGVDLGLDYITSKGPQTFSMGLSLLDIYTILHTESNDEDLEVQTQPLVVNFGTAWEATVGGGFGVTVSADIKNLQEQMEFSRRLHLGLEVALSPALSLLAGLNSVDNYSYGLQLNTGLINLYAGFYNTEIGERVQQQDSERVVVYFSLFDFKFDP